MSLRSIAAATASVASALASSSIQLFDLHLRKTNGNIVMRCTSSFLEMLRTRLGAPLGCSLRIGTFDFVQVSKNRYVGIPDERNAESQAESLRVCSTVLALYRASITFERVFNAPNSYATWFLFNQRVPSVPEMAQMARDRGIRIPFLSFPFNGQIDKPTVVVSPAVPRYAPPLETRSVGSTTLRLPKKPAKATPPTVDPGRLEALVARFAKR